MTKTMTVEGMMCGMCEAHVADTLRKVPGVSKVTASHSKNLVTIRSEESESDQALLDAVNATGYRASNVQLAPEGEKKGIFGFKRK